MAEYAKVCDQNNKYQEADDITQAMSIVAKNIKTVRKSGKYQVCPECQGEGKIVNPSVSVWTGQDIDEDPEGFDDMRSGLHDISCPACDGKRVVTKEELNNYYEDRRDRRTMLQESGEFSDY